MKDNFYNIDFDAVNHGFGRMADVYDELQKTNAIVGIMRRKYYNVIMETINPPADILELNCGSGIDALYLSGKGYNILATDISEKMLENARLKGNNENLNFKQLNFNQLNNIEGCFDLIISNFGGLNCYDDLNFISEQTARLLKPGGYFIATVMPKFSLWELALIFKGELKRGLRRINQNGTIANVGGEKVFVRYYSPSYFYKYFRNRFNFIKIKAPSVFFPPPTALNWYHSHLKISSFFYKLDKIIENLFLSAFFGDYYIIVLKKRGIE